jgi:hypothetical protein
MDDQISGATVGNWISGILAKFQGTTVTLGPFTIPLPLTERWHSERAEAERLISFLEQRRALFYDFTHEVWIFVEPSILEIRQHLVILLQRLDRSTPLANSVRSMSIACHEFLDFAVRHPLDDDEESRSALLKLRREFGVHLALIVVHYDINVYGGLATMLPGDRYVRPKWKSSTKKSEKRLLEELLVAVWSKTQ